MNFRNSVKGKNVIVCLNNGKLHLSDPFEHKWLCDESRTADQSICEEKSQLMIRDFLTYIIQQTEVLRSYGQLEKIWENLKREPDKSTYIAEHFLSRINEYYLEDSPKLRNASMCEKCLGIFLGNIFALSEDFEE